MPRRRDKALPSRAVRIRYAREMKISVEKLLVGPVAAFGPDGVPSGIDKHVVDHPVRLGREGLTGDAQGDRKRHGGVDKALHHYPREHYSAWRNELGSAAVLSRWGAFGENLSTSGLTEADVAVGDVFRIGTALIEVSQGRQPCWKLNIRFGVPDMAKRVQASGRTGWYYRVLEEGVISPGDVLERVERRWPEWTLARLWRILYVDMLNTGDLAAMAQLAGLPESWRRLAERRLERLQVEDWTPRLVGHQKR